MGTRKHVCALRSRPLQPTTRRASRRQVSEPIGSGRSFRREQSRRKAPGRAKARPASDPWNLGWISPEQRVSARKREHPRHRERPLDMASRRRPAAVAGSLFRQGLGRSDRVSSSNVDPRMRMSSRTGAGRGAGWPIEVQAIRSVVLVDCVDCRSRRAAPGLSPDGDGSSLSLG